MSDEPSPLEWSDESEVQMYADGGRKLKWSPSTYTFQTRQTVKHPHPPPSNHARPSSRRLTPRRGASNCVFIDNSIGAYICLVR